MRYLKIAGRTAIFGLAMSLTYPAIAQEGKQTSLWVEGQYVSAFNEKNLDLICAASPRITSKKKLGFLATSSLTINTLKSMAA
jgi:hypothetical protein